jgi:NAD-dependent DNA ligase
VIETQGEHKVKTVCFSGKMKHPRSYYEKMAKEKGYEPVNTVSKSLTRLVIAPNTESTKVKKARLLNIPIVEVDNWWL